MHFKLFVELCITFSVIYILMGDVFLPQPHRSNSQQVRSDINEFLVSLLPDKKPDLQRKLNRNS